MVNLKSTLLKGLLFAAFAVTPFAVAQAQPQAPANTVEIEKSSVSWGVYWGRPYYGRGYNYGYYNYYRPYNYYYYPYRPYYYYYW